MTDSLDRHALALDARRAGMPHLATRILAARSDEALEWIAAPVLLEDVDEDGRRREEPR